MIVMSECLFNEVSFCRVERAARMAAVEGEKVEKEKVLPKDAQVMVAILKDMGIHDFEPRVVNQMLEFSYR